MNKPNPTDYVYVVVHEKPNKVWVSCNGLMHFAKWRTSDTRDNLYAVSGNAGILNAALLAWDGHGHFVTTFADLEKRSQGWGAWS